MADDDGTSGTKTFTQADLDKAAAAAAHRVRTQLSDKYADYDDLKAAAEAGNKSKSDIEKLTASVQALTDRATKAEHENARRTIADEFGLTSREARRLAGKTLDELRADAEGLIEDLGIDVKARKSGKGGTTKTGTEGDDTDGTDDKGAQQDEGDSQATSRQTASTRTARPRETLQSGASRTPTAPEVTNPMELVKNIPRY